MEEDIVLERVVRVALQDGLHARPASRLVQLAKRFRARIELERDGLSASARSSVRLMLLAVKQDEAVTVRVSGDDAAAAFDAVAAFLESDRDGEGESAVAAPSESIAAPAPATVAAGGLRGVGASQGCAIGPVHPCFPVELPALPDAPGTALDVDGECARLREALAAVVQALRARATEDATRRSIVDALIEVAVDEEWQQEIEARVRDGFEAPCAVRLAGEALAARFAAVEDAYLRARAEDVRSVARALACRLHGLPDATLADVPEGAVVVADELSALDLADAPLARIAALVCRQGGATSHAAIVARAHGVPAVFGVEAAVEALLGARVAAVDGSGGVVHLDPDDATRTAFEARIAAQRVARAALQRWRGVSPRTRTGREITVAANLGSLAEIDAARAAGAMGVGLFRTELLFMQRPTLPTEDEQAETYRRLAEAFAPQAVVIRTLDVGGDKPLPGVDVPREDNPFLGWRGVRLCLDRPDLFKPQLRALLRAAVVGNVQVMVPMVSDLEEVRRVQSLVDACEAELVREGVPCARFPLGIMVETPAAVLQADALAQSVAFFSIGTNDLTQYVMAADRANARVAPLYRAGHPAVMRAIELTCEAARRHGGWVGVCGEAAADPALIPRFVQMGVTELSMSPASILAAKEQICGL